MNPIYARRRRRNLIVRALCNAAALFGITFLGLILFTLFKEGVGGLGLSVFTQMTPPPGSNSGGLANAIVGSVMITFMGVAIGAPLGDDGGSGEKVGGIITASSGPGGHFVSSSGKQAGQPCDSQPSRNVRQNGEIGKVWRGGRLEITSSFDRRRRGGQTGNRSATAVRPFCTTRARRSFRDCDGRRSLEASTWVRFPTLARLA